MTPVVLSSPKYTPIQLTVSSTKSVQSASFFSTTDLSAKYTSYKPVNVAQNLSHSLIYTPKVIDPHVTSTRHSAVTYDKSKLDQIINRIKSTQSIKYTPTKVHIETKPVVETAKYTPTRVHVETKAQAHVHEVCYCTKQQEIVVCPHCGQVEEKQKDSWSRLYADDIDSEREIKAEEVHEKSVENSHEEAPKNEEKPRNKKTGKRQEVTEDRRKRNVGNDEEFKRKGVYDQKHKDQMTKDQAEKLLKDEDEIKDFDFGKNKTQKSN